MQSGRGAIDGAGVQSGRGNRRAGGGSQGGAIDGAGIHYSRGGEREGVVSSMPAL